MRKPDNKLVKTMMMGALAMMMLCSYKVSATETLIIKCTSNKGAVVYQDHCCPDDQIMELLRVATNSVTTNQVTDGN